MPNVTLTESELLSVVNALLTAKTAYERDRDGFAKSGDTRMSEQFATQATEADQMADRLMEVL
jgi:hypothetical protein